MIIKDNYITVILSHESRVTHGIAQHETVFPFCSGDDLQIAEASKAANHLQAKLEQQGVFSQLAVYAPIVELPDVPSILDGRSGRTRESRVQRARRHNKRPPYSQRWKSGRIGENSA